MMNVTSVRLHKIFFSLLTTILLSFLVGHHPIHADTIFQQVGIASPPAPVGSGARAMGMGGAFIAVADDATAASWNPAGLIQLEKPELSIVGAFDHRSSSFSSQSHPEIDGTATDDITSLNYFSAALPFHWYKNLVVSANYQRLYDFNQTFSHDLTITSPELTLDRQTSFDQSGFVGALGLAGAVELTPTLSAGLTLNVWSDQLGWNNGWQSRYHARTSGTMAGLPITNVTTIEEEYEKFRGINFNLGLLWETDWGTLGAVIKTPFRATLVHHFDFSSATEGEPPSAPIDIDEEVSLRMPLSYGIGWSKRFADRTTLSLDVTRIHWEDYKLTDSQGNDFSPIDGRPISQSNIAPTIHVRAGYEYVIPLPAKALALALRAGLFYDPEPAQDSSNDFYGLSLGAGLSRNRFSLDVAYQLRWGHDIDSNQLIATSNADVTQHSVLASLIYYFQ
ncbi:MAG: outer membrane protein transport protein [Desulfatitalea sp.]